MHDNYTCLIVDDELDAIELLTDKIAHLYKNIRITGTHQHWESALDALREQQCDLVFMDISMPGKNAIELLKLLPGIDIEIIFVTAFEQYALNAFAFSTSGYVLKPIDDEAFAAAVNKAIIRIKNKRLAKKHNSPHPANDRIGIPNNHGIDYVDIKDILYLESVNKCTKIVTAARTYTSLSPLMKFKSHTDHYSFLQVHRSFIVNLSCILRYESSGLIIMSNKQEIPLSRSYKSDFLLKFNNTF